MIDLRNALDPQRPPMAVRRFSLLRALTEAWRAAQALQRNERGTAALLTGAMASVLIGFAGLVADGGRWYVERRSAQTAADAAAQAATLALLRGQDVTATARDMAARNGFDPAHADTTVRVRAFRRAPNPGMEDAVEVIVEREVPMLFGRIIRLAAGQAQANGTDRVRIAARAVAQAMTLPGGAGGACVLALGDAGGMVVQENDLQIGGNTRLNAPQCSLASNTSIRQFGNSRIVAYTMVAAGTVSIGNPQNVTLARPAAAFQPPVRDPFAPDVPGTGIPLPPNNQSCTETGYRSSPSTNQPLVPGVYCDGMDLKGRHDFAPGVYYIQRGDLTVNAQANLTCSSCTPGNGVTFVFTGEPAQIGGPKINGGARIDLLGGTAAFPAMLMYQDPRRPVAANYKLNGGANIRTAGLFYFPSSDLEVNGNFGGDNVTCKAFIAESITLTGTTTQTIRVDGCADLGLDPATELPQLRIVRLVE